MTTTPATPPAPQAGPPAGPQAATPAASGRTYTNPLPYRDHLPRTNPDPYVTRFNTRYWCYSTGDQGVNVSSSEDLITWDLHGYALVEPAGRQFWAPCVVHADGRFWMYLSFRPHDSEDPHDERLHVAVSDTPQGPFTLVKRLFDTFSIDADVTRDPDSGRWLLHYSTNDANGPASTRAGTAIVVDELVTMTELAHHPHPVVTPTLEEEIFQRNRFGDGRDWYTIEGATCFTAHGTRFLTYSGNAYVGTDYFIGYATAPDTGRLFESTWHRHPDDHTWGPLVKRSDTVEGTGHNSVVRGPDLVSTWLVYHGRDAAQTLDPDTEQRVMRLDRVETPTRRLLTAAPTSTPQPAPDAPTLIDTFHDEDWTRHWTLEEGSARVEHLTPSSTTPHPVTDFLHTTTARTTRLTSHHTGVAHVAELTVRATPSDAGCCFGISPIHHGPLDHTDVLLDTGRRILSVTTTHAGITRELRHCPLPHIDPTQWHLLRVERAYTDLAIILDGMHLATLTCEDADEGHVALLSLGTATDIASLVLTDHLDLWGPSLHRQAHHHFRAETPTTVTDDGLGSTTPTPLTLTTRPLPAGYRAAYDLGLLGPKGRATLQIFSPTGEETLRVDVTHGHALVKHTGPHGPQEIPLETNPLPSDVLLTLRVSHEGVALNVEGTPLDLPITLSAHHRHALTLTSALVRGVTHTQTHDGRAVQHRE